MRSRRADYGLKVLTPALLLVLTAAAAAAEDPQDATGGARAVAAGQDGFAIQSADGAFRLQIGLLVHADGRFALGGADEEVIDTFAFRRLRPYLKGGG